ncbi:MAG: 23S rRNA (adenine(2503)-C(2))-methyltransferase RlmN [Candidatus Rokubacteria bacterium]|nr:23S rRNA (adenine(2503)-C(2))-methyltransferase RlmN [Candidatus Rokubacteria bacterium]
MSRVNLLECAPRELEALAERCGQPRYRGSQLAGWLFRRGILDLNAMSNLPREFCQRLAAEAVIEAPVIARCIASRDGSQKFVLRLSDGAEIQSVLMPDADRLTLCLSTQVGCGFACAFCFTGTMGLGRNLSAGEIVGQLVAVRSTLPAGSRVTHLVYMGMGEPLANYAATVKSLRLLTDPGAFGYSPRRVTVSTVGLVSGIAKLAKENLRVNLAVSLHATTNPVRSRLMPVNKGRGLEELLAACRSFPLPLRRRMTFEYVLLHEVNDSREDALRLARLLEGIRAKVNLIPFNDWAGAGFSRPPLSRILDFQTRLLERGVTATIRWSKGEDIGAACGQLAEAPEGEDGMGAAPPARRPEAGRRTIRA